MGSNDNEGIASDAEKSRELIRSLYQLVPNDWNDWELDWMEAQLRRHRKYTLSEKEQAIVTKLNRSAREHHEYEGRSVAEWIDVAYRFRADLSEAQCDLVEEWHKKRLTLLRQRQLGQLVKMLKQVEAIERVE